MVPARSLMANNRPELLLNKADVDRTFSFHKSQWTEIAPQMIEPGWALRFAEHPTGTQVIGMDRSTGIALSIKPFFATETDLPIMVVIGNYFPLGMFPSLTNKAKSVMELMAQNELGKWYVVKLVHRNTDLFEMFEFEISEL